MGNMFKDILGSNESLFKNEAALDYTYQPKIIPYRENEQRYIVSCIKPLFLSRSGKNVFVYGLPGVGKTAACNHIKKEIEEETDDIVPIYINCWQKNTTHKIILDICELLDYKFTQNRRTEELFAVMRQLLNRKSAVFVFDEIDKLDDVDLLYMIIEEIYKKSIIMITNHMEWLANLDERIRSRLMAECIEFKPYNYEQTKGILQQRMEYAFFSEVWNGDALELISKKTAEAKDIRIGLYLLKESADIAESKSSRKILLEHAKEALLKLNDFSIKDKDDLSSEEQTILELVKHNSGARIGSLFKLYQANGGNLVYKSFQRKMDKLEKNRFICFEKTEGGEYGNTTIVRYSDVKKLTEF